jgi:hypothetical protein
MMKELSMHIMDITQNSVRAQAKNIEITVTENPAENLFAFSVKDDGFGMSEELLKRVTDPFATTRTTRKVGLGIPFLRQTCEMCGGKLVLQSSEGKGTYLQASMEYDNIDRPPAGDIASSIFLIIQMNPGIIFKYSYSYNSGSFELDMREVLEVLGGVPADTPEVSAWLKENIREEMENCRTMEGK